MSHFSTTSSGTVTTRSVRLFFFFFLGRSPVVITCHGVYSLYISLSVALVLINFPGQSINEQFFSFETENQILEYCKCSNIKHCSLLCSIHYLSSCLCLLLILLICYAGLLGNYYSFSQMQPSNIHNWTMWWRKQSRCTNCR